MQRRIRSLSFWIARQPARAEGYCKNQCGTCVVTTVHVGICTYANGYVRIRIFGLLQCFEKRARRDWSRRYSSGSEGMEMHLRSRACIRLYTHICVCVCVERERERYFGGRKNCSTLIGREFFARERARIVRRLSLCRYWIPRARFFLFFLFFFLYRSHRTKCTRLFAAEARGHFALKGFLASTKASHLRRIRF